MTSRTVPLLTKAEFYEAVERSGCLREGHLTFQDLHHEFYLHPGVLLGWQRDPPFARRIGDRLLKAVSEQVDLLLLPENSEVTDFAEFLMAWFRPRQPAVILPYRKRPPASSTVTPYVIDAELRDKCNGKVVALVDSGTVTGESVLSVRDGLIRSRCRSIHILTIFHRKDDEWTRNLTEVSGDHLPVRYYYCGELYSPVWRRRDCPIETEIEYWRNREIRYTSRRAQLQLRQMLHILHEIATKSIDWTAYAPGRAHHSPATLTFESLMSPGLYSGATTYAKFRLLNEFFRSRMFSEVLPATGDTRSISVANAVAVVAVATSGIVHGAAVDKLSNRQRRYVVEACHIVSSSADVRPRDRWHAIRLIRQLTPRSFAHQLPDFLRSAQLDESLYLPVVDNIFAMLEERSDSAESVRWAFDVARRDLDEEFHISQTHAFDDKEYRRRGGIIYDLRQDQISLLPVGRAEYDLKQVLLPLCDVLVGSKLGHTPVAKALDNLVHDLTETARPRGTPAASAPYTPWTPSRELRWHLDHWNDEAYGQLKRIHTLLQRLLELSPDLPAQYLLSSSSPNMYADIERCNSAIVNLSRWHRERVQPGPRRVRAELRLLRITLSRILRSVFDEGSEVQKHVRAWLIDICSELASHAILYQPRLTARAIEFEWRCEATTAHVLWNRIHMHHALGNFFQDALKEDSGPFPQPHRGERKIRVDVRDGPEHRTVEVVWSDTGIGIGDDVIESISSGGGRGTLSSIKRRLRRVGGDLVVRRDDVIGTSFVMTVLGIDG